MIKLENIYHEKVANDKLNDLNGKMAKRLTYGEKLYVYLKHLERNTDDAFNIFTNTMYKIER